MRLSADHTPMDLEYAKIQGVVARWSEVSAARSDALINTLPSTTGLSPNRLYPPRAEFSMERKSEGGAVELPHGSHLTREDDRVIDARMGSFGSTRGLDASDEV